ncbi:Uncharacterized membrane protein YoaK, UPF0700 family [Nannocystis exedens]|uniref:Uncharacterized membrane protein YoaK, UPF0700 family n=1 Tax=Nannocystis exedens TaxID=54 RepID=A0A1I1UWI3_9BACT|nr:YoaK family protein [Nannocystis exedens]PCC72151.1 hypothetical protein NAEX_05230 [Nannocystis exedens]SFD75172.1 Uncharacterized membrane protein YoaK, UPF0700 family [Nannocystis exedens]
MLALHPPDSVFSLRHVPSWLMLAFAAGCVNATAALACGRYVTHVTGTVTRIGMEWNSLWLALDLVLVLVCFLVGAMTSGLVINGRAHRGRRPLYSLPLIGVAVADFAIAAAGDAGWFGAFGGEIDQTSDFVFLSLLSFAMGLQNGAVATSTGLLVRTTHLTGPATDLGIHLAELFFVEGKARETARQHALLRAGKIATFASGAAAAVQLAPRFEYLVLVVPAVMTLLATWLSFLRARPARHGGV